jgi:OOP family OmpA-OmpF porin
MRKFILSLWVMCFWCVTKAQFSIALVAGPQANSVTPAFTLYPDSTSGYNVSKHIGLNLGLIANTSLNKKQNLFFQTGFLYSAKGSQVIQQFDTSLVNLSDGKKHLLQATTNLKINYIDIPVNLLYKYPLKGKTKLLLGGGLQAFLFYNGSTDFNSIKIYRDDIDTTTQLDYEQIINKDLAVGTAANKFSTFHFSVNALTGLEFGKVFITVSYSNGLSSFYKSDAQSFKHKTLGFHFGIYLGNSNHPKDINTTTAVINDRDLDGVIDELDQCPDLAGTILMKGCPDKDGDGISDIDDQCPEQPGTLQNKGCPIFDKDSDGVMDEEDKCPDVAGLKKYNGCPVPDSDHDGVNDEEDQCPTIAGDKDNLGCPKVTKEQQQKIEYAEKRIQFEYKKADLLPSSFKVLDEVVEILKTNASFKIRVDGHSSGPETESNRLLSQKRAESVKEFFISRGIAPTRIVAQGFGSSRHISIDGNLKENPEDRRVELVIF